MSNRSFERSIDLDLMHMKNVEQPWTKDKTVLFRDFAAPVHPRLISLI